MKRNPTRLTEREFDLLVIGGGIYGVCTAWDAALRGFSVALIERHDFGSATSSNSLKIIHGGLRYLQHADLRRMRESIAERRTLMRIAPHLVHPLPCLMPTYGHGLKGREVMALALWMNDLVGFDRNKELDPQKFMPSGKVLSRSECLKLIPGIDDDGLTGAALWYDCQVYNAERMLISIVRSAVEAGAEAANYVAMTGFIKEGDSITGVVATDGLTKDEFEIRAKLVVNNAGPWVNEILSRLNGRQVDAPTRLSSAMNVVVRRKIFPDYAVGLWSKSTFKDDDAVLSKGSRLYFLTPWREYTVIGTTHDHYKGSPDEFSVQDEAVSNFISEVNQALPRLDLKAEDITLVYSGMLPVGREQAAAGDVKLLKHYQIIDHKVQHGVDGLVSVVGVKYTTARDVAQRTVDFALEKLVKPASVCRTGFTLFQVGDIERFEEFVRNAKNQSPGGLSAEATERLVYNYGSVYPAILDYGKENAEWLQTVDDSNAVLQAEVIHAIREEMAVKLSDVVRRRTEIGTGEYPGDAAVASCARLIASELGWDEARITAEIAETRAIYGR